MKQLMLLLLLTIHLAYGQEVSLSTAARPDTAEWGLLRLKIKDETFFINAGPSQQHYFDRGQLKSRMQDYQGAIADFDRCLALAPGSSLNYAVYYARAAAKELRGDLPGAVADFTQLVTLKPDFEWGWNDRAQTYIKLNKFTEAEADLLKALELRPEWSVPFFNLGLVYARKNVPLKAIPYYTKSIELNPDNPLAHNNLGRMYFSLKQYDQAIESYTRALRLFPSYVNALTNRAEARLTRGDQSGACQDVKAAADLGDAQSLKYFNAVCARK